MRLRNWSLIGVACAVCCAPPLSALLGIGGVAGIGVAASGWVVKLRASEIACAGMLAATVAFGIGWALFSRGGASVKGAEGCEIGGPRDPAGSASVA